MSNQFSDRFNQWMDFVLQWEGPYENVPGDKGGETAWGIDQASHPGVDIKNLTKDGAKAIYHQEAWDVFQAEQMPKGVAEVLSNIVINTGKGHISWLQSLVGATPDNNIGPKSLELINKQDPKQLCEKLLDRLEAFYNRIGTGEDKKFLKGWLNRTNSLRNLVMKKFD
jgi:lysozyme family protein